MSNVAVQGDGAVVVTGGNIAEPPTSSDPNFTHVARPSGFGVTSSATAAAAPTAPAPPGDTQPADARTSVEASPPPPPAGATTAAAPPASSVPPPAPAPPPPSSAPPPPPPPAQPAPAATSAVEAAEPPPPPAAPAPTSSPPPEPAPAPAEPTAPAEGQTVIDQFNASSAVDGAAPGSTGIAGANVFAPDVEGDQAGAGESDINPAYTVDQTSSSPSPSSTEETSTSSTQPASTSSSRTTSSSASANRSSSATSSHESSSSASASAEETTETISTTEQPESSSSASAENASQVTQVTTASAPEASAAEQATSQADTTFVSGSTTFTGSAALAAAAAAETGGSKQEKGKDGLSSFAIVGIVGGILVFFILLYVAWFQWRKRRARNDMERLEDVDSVSPISGGYDPFGLAYEKHSGLDFFDEPLSSRRSQKSRVKSNAPSVMPHNPFSETAIIANPDPTPAPTAEDEDYERRLETQYTESLYTDPGDAELGTAKSQRWFAEEDDDRRPSYIDGPQSIYHESNDPDNPNAHPWTEVPLSARSPQSAKNPAPPVPPLPAAYQSQKQKRNTRPETDFSYGNFYEGYDDPESRPVTQHTPSTSALLPWLNRETDAPPPIPVSGPVDPKTLPVHQPQRKGTGFGSPPKMPLRTPPSAAIAGKPEVPNKGWMGVIPSFR